MKKIFLLMGACFLSIINFSAKDCNWEPTGPTAEDIKASEPTSLEMALQKGDLSWVKNFVQKGGNINTCDSFGNPMLISAIIHRHIHLVQYLVENGANVNKRSDWVVQGDEKGDTALMIAAQTNDLSLVKYLVQNGADLTITDNSGLTVAMWVQRFCLSAAIKEYFKTIAATPKTSKNN